MYNASAGSGKTYTLVREYLRIILTTEDPSKFRRILAMTFTNKAANEMKQRVLQKLIQLAKSPQNKSQDDWAELKSFAETFELSEDKLMSNAERCLNQILHNYSLFSVMTIDKFTHKVIRTFARELGLSLDFNVELDLDTIRSNVADLLFDQIGRDDEVTKLMIAYADNLLSDDKGWNFKSDLVDFSRQLYKEDSLKAIRALSDLNGDDFIKIKNKLIEDRAKFENTLVRIGTEALDLIHAKNLDETDFKGASRGVTSFFKKLKNKEFKAPSDTIYKYCNEDSWANAKSYNTATVDEITPLLKKYFDQAVQMIEEKLGDYLLQKELLKNINNLSLMKHLLAITDDLKEEENILLISDFYKKIAGIIADEPVPFIYERLGVRYDHFLLDEFQDTSHLQWINLVPLLHNSLSEKKFNLIVGDGKQAIYRWRNGEVDQFVQLPNNIYNPENIMSLKEAQSTFKNEGKLLILKDNYRSAPEIVDFNNAFFDYLGPLYGDYIHDIYKEHRQNPIKKHQGYVEFNLIEDKDDQIQLDYVTSVIRQSLAKNFGLKDICVLVRTKSDGTKIAQHLTDLGIKIISAESLHVSKDLHVRFLSNLIAAAANPGNSNHGKKCLEQYHQLFDIQEELFEKKEQFNIFIWLKNQGKEIVPYEQFHSFYEYCEHLIEVLGFDINDNNYLLHFLEQIHQYEKGHGNNIIGFVEWFDDKGRNEAVQSPEGAEAVQVMTIHAAKGLQFPIVICPFFDWNYKGKASEIWLTDGEVLPAYPLLPKSDLKKTIHAADMEIEETKMVMDVLNIVYVALTRPEVALFVSGSTKKQVSLAKHWFEAFINSNQTLGFTEKDKKYFLGIFENKVSKDEDTSHAFDLRFCDQKMHKPPMSTKHGDQWDIHDMDKRRLYGTQLHLVLSELNSLDELESILERNLIKRKIDTEHLDEIRGDLNRLFKHQRFIEYFQAPKSINEKVIIDELGNKHIPDKIILEDNALLIIEFKTGEPDFETHKEQVSTYIKLLKAISGKKVSGEIFYTEDGSVIEVPS
nr:UvrD-helicase domain-containing protein [Paracrocinitomix mangrovi]